MLPVVLFCFVGLFILLSLQIENWSEDGRDGDFLDDMAEGNVPNVRDWRDQVTSHLL